VSALDASPLVELVESGAFLFEEEATQRAVTTYVRDLEASIPDVRVITLSSTHLPWLRRYFEAAAPNIRFLDPIDVILDTIAPHATVGTGTVAGIVTENPTYPSASFLAMMTQLSIDVPVEVIDGFHRGSMN
jgi:glutamate racemase